jgi:hypothetical protein
VIDSVCSCQVSAVLYDAFPTALHKARPFVTVFQAFVRTAAAAYGRICLWVRPAPPGQDPARSPSAAQDKGRPRPPSGKTGGKPRGSTDGGKGGAGQVSKSMTMKRGSVDKANSPPPLAPDPGGINTDNERHDHGPPPEWGVKEGACLLVLEAAPLLANRLHVERTLLLKEQPKPEAADGGPGSPPESPKAGPPESSGLPVGALSVKSVLGGYSRVVVAVTMTQPLLSGEPSCPACIVPIPSYGGCSSVKTPLAVRVIEFQVTQQCHFDIVSARHGCSFREKVRLASSIDTDA